MGRITGRYRTVWVVAVVLGAWAAGAVGLEIVPTYVDGAGETWTAARQGVIEQAIADWEASILDDQTIQVSMEFSHAGTGGYLGLWSGGGWFYPGDDIYPWTDGVEQSVIFNVDHFSGDWYTWWDPTPTTWGDQPFYGFDALSVARHEFGHMMGFADGYYVDDVFGANTDRWLENVQPGTTTFDPGGLNVELAGLGNLTHLADSGATAGDLMVPALSNNVRRPISRTDLEMLSLAHGYTLADMIGDFDGNGAITSYDADMLWRVLGNSVPPTQAKFDLNGDGEITLADAEQLVKGIVGTSMADTNLDREINIIDLGNLADRYGLMGTFSNGDTNGDKVINIIDLGNLADDYGKIYAGSAPHVPEPATLALSALGAFIVIRRRR